MKNLKILILLFAVVFFPSCGSNQTESQNVENAPIEEATEDPTKEASKEDEEEVTSDKENNSEELSKKEILEKIRDHFFEIDNFQVDIESHSEITYNEDNKTTTDSKSVKKKLMESHIQFMKLLC